MINKNKNVIKGSFVAKKYCSEFDTFLQRVARANSVESITYSKYRNKAKAIIIVKNNNLKDYVTEYEDFVYETILVDEKHFKDTSSYSYYIESVDFWKLFLDKFEYIYIYQTDCFLLKDNLNIEK